ncbi:hypothetical protein MJD09_16895 [bacterium]|nr:hypothetical protein [bacterium]
MKVTLVIKLLICFCTNALAQGIQSQQGTISITPVYQSWKLDTNPDFSEFTLPLFIYYPLNRNLNFTLRGNQANVTGDNLESLSGVTDAQFGLNYFLENPNVIVSLGFNLPTGKAALDTAEFRTSSLISNNIFSLRTPNFGQGLNVTAGFTWAVPVNEALVVGLGASYQLKGGFKPLASFVEDYKPGNEILLTGGMDFRLGTTGTLSTDVTVTFYSTDKIGQDEVFSIGNKAVISGQFKQFFGFNELTFFARYRTRAKNQQAVILGQQLEPEVKKTFPDQLELLANYRLRLSRKVYLKILGEGRFYDETASAFSGVSLFGGGVASEIALSRSLNLPLGVKYLFGNFKGGQNLTGFEVWLGLASTF